MSSTSYTWDGRLDEVAVYGSALSASAVEEHYAYGSRKGWVDIELLNGTTVAKQIADDTLNDNEYSWYIENTVPAGTNYFVRVPALLTTFHCTTRATMHSKSPPQSPSTS